MEHFQALPAGTMLGGDYRIIGVLGQGGFGLTYRANDVNLKADVAIKEYFHIDSCTRDDTQSVRPRTVKDERMFTWGRDSFLKEAQTLSRFNHPAIVRVFRVLQERNTAYFVMQFEPGQSFAQWLDGLGRPPTQIELDRIAAPLLDALEVLHAEQIIHRDIAPDNIQIRPNGTPVLLDFGAARQAVAEQSQNLTGIVKAGYSPAEQYGRRQGRQGPWSDIYALGATFYRAVTGVAPPDSPDRQLDDDLVPAAQAASPGYRPAFLAALDAALALKPGDRPQSVAAWREILLPPSPVKVAIPRPEPVTTPSSSLSPGRSSNPRSRVTRPAAPVLQSASATRSVRESSQASAYPAPPSNRPSARPSEPPRATPAVQPPRSNVALSSSVISPDIPAAVLVLALSAVALWQSFSLSVGTLSRMGPGMIPRTIAVLLLVLGLALLVRGFVMGAIWPNAGSLRPPLTALAALAVMVTGMAIGLGFLATLPVALGVVALGVVERRFETVVATAGISVAGFALIYLAISNTIPLLPQLIAR